MMEECEEHQRDFWLSHLEFLEVAEHSIRGYGYTLRAPFHYLSCPPTPAIIWEAIHDSFNRQGS
jgi:hypothetical protein